ncbi:MAG: YihY/virulence factor BrkB family protein [Pyrinomonadaceae bacterium]|nr:YihY/virulence factor BrkB family protein [Pyrinomonadaceae bacterium]
MASGWRLGGLTPKELARHVWLEIYEGDLFTRTAALSYYFLLALFPLLLFLTTMLGYFAERGTALRTSLLNYFSRVLPRSASALIYTTVEEINKNATGGKLSFSIFAALWAASYGMVAISDTLNGAYGVRESRSWWRLRLSAIGLTIALSVLIISALALVLYGGEVGGAIAGYFNQGGLFLVVWNIVQVPLVLAFVLLAFALIYYFSPNLLDQKWYWITPGSIIGVALWLLVSFLFRVYLRYFDSYSLTYGSLGAVIILMLWFYLTGAAILIGGKINAEIEAAAAEEGVPGAKHHGEKIAPEESDLSDTVAAVARATETEDDQPNSK